MVEWFNRNFRTVIYISFLVPIITVAIVSISHVTQWYGISNPLSWAVYLSIGIEIAALSALAAISAQMGSKVYFPFGIVTLIQFVGNIFFAFEYIKIDSEQFLSWVELTAPILQYTGIEQGDLQSHRRFLAIFAGGMLPLISLSFLHMLVKFNEEKKGEVLPKEPKNDNTSETKDLKEDPIPASDIVAEVSRFRPSKEDLDRIEEMLSKIPHEEPKERITKEKQRELLTQMMRESEEMGLYDEPFNNPLIKDYKTPQNASEMMITNDEDIIDSIPSDEEISDWDMTPEPPSWLDEIPEPTEEDFRDWDVTLTDGLDEFSHDNNVSYMDYQDQPDVTDTKDNFDEDHALDVVLNDMVSNLSPRDISKIVEESEKDSDPNEELVEISEELKKKIPNKYEQIEEYINYTRGAEEVVEKTEIPEPTQDIKSIEVVLDQFPTPDQLDISVDIVQLTPSPTPPSPTPNFIFKTPLPLGEDQDLNDPEKKN